MLEYKSVAISSGGVGYSSDFPPQCIIQSPQPISNEVISGISSVKGFSGVIAGVSAVSVGSSYRVIFDIKVDELYNSWMNTLLIGYPLYVYDTSVAHLEPLKGLSKLITLNVSGTRVTDLEPISGLTNLQRLDIERTQISDLEPIRGLKILQGLTIINCENITDEQVDDLQNTLPNLKIYRHLNTEE